MTKHKPGHGFLYEFVVEWGDCDPADIVYYPNYYRWFDNASHRMFRQAGYDLAMVREEYAALGFPLVSARADFRASAQVGDRLCVESAVAAIGRKSITVDHRIRRDETLLVDGREVRIMGIRRADGALSAGVIPQALRDYFGYSSER